MAEKKNLCALIPLELHTQVCEAKEAAGQTTNEYITNLLIEYFKMKENGGTAAMTNHNTRTLAFQISDELFQRIKAHLERETARTGKKLTQREFVLGLIEEALNEAERQASVSPCEALEDGGDPQPPEEGESDLSGEEKPA